MIKQTMDYIKSNVLKEHVRKISGKQEAERFGTIHTMLLRKQL